MAFQPSLPASFPAAGVGVAAGAAMTGVSTAGAAGSQRQQEHGGQQRGRVFAVGHGKFLLGDGVFGVFADILH